MNYKAQNTKTGLLFALSLSLLMAGCGEKKDSSADSPALSKPANDAVVDANNSGKNARDRSNSTATPGDQSGAPADLKTTQAIRQALVSGTNHYSLTARNVKIITINNKVVLRGPVKTAEEKAGIVAIAKNIAGESNVEDQLEVEASP